MSVKTACHFTLLPSCNFRKSVHLAGQLDMTPALDISAQTQQTLDNIDRLLAEAGTDKTHILSVFIFLKDIEKDYAAMNAVCGCVDC